MQSVTLSLLLQWSTLPLGHRDVKSEDPAAVVDHPVVHVHLAEVAEVVLAAQPLAGLRHAGEAEAAAREKVLVRSTRAIKSGTAEN